MPSVQVECVHFIDEGNAPLSSVAPTRCYQRVAITLGLQEVQHLLQQTSCNRTIAAWLEALPRGSCSEMLEASTAAPARRAALARLSVFRPRLNLIYYRVKFVSCLHQINCNILPRSSSTKIADMFVIVQMLILKVLIMFRPAGRASTTIHIQQGTRAPRTGGQQQVRTHARARRSAGFAS